LRSNTKGYGGEIHYTDSQNRNTTAPNSRELVVLAPGGQCGNIWIHLRTSAKHYTIELDILCF